MSVDKFREAVLGIIPDGATSYRLLMQNSDGLWYYPPEGKKALRLNPFDLPVVKTGKYVVVYEDADTNRKMPQEPLTVSWVFPGEMAAPPALEIRERNETDGDDLRLSLEMEQTAADASTVRARAASLTDTLSLYRGFTAMMGTQSAHELQGEERTVRSAEPSLHETAGDSGGADGHLPPARRQPAHATTAAAVGQDRGCRCPCLRGDVRRDGPGHQG
jgi:hypothetical protein